ncbi:MAG: diaminopimelate epimerase [Polyangiaceae bacterium]
MRFEKYEGLGNDFVLVDETGTDPSHTSPAHSSHPSIDRIAPRVVHICDRHRGVGADGVLLILPARSTGAAATMVVLNADGSRPEMCGNGLRCVAAYLANKVRSTRSQQDREQPIELDIDTDAGLKHCVVTGDLVTIDMGTAIDEGLLELTPSLIVDNSNDPRSQGWQAWGLENNTKALRAHKISTGNPHAILFHAETTADTPFERLGSALTSHRLFPQGSNIEMARVVSPTRIDVRVWERGVGPTLACGTGACATVVAAVVEGLSLPNQEVCVNLPGGALFITVDTNLKITMRGPAKRVFSGELFS